MTSYGSAAYAYGANGELRTKVVGTDTTKYTYDALGNLTHVGLPDGTAIDYVIDAQNRRIGKKVNGTLVKGWLYLGQLAPVAEIDGAGIVTARFVYATGLNVPDYVVKGDSTYRLIRDHLGSVRLVVNVQSGTVAQRIDYDEFGVEIQNSSPGFQPFGFAGGLTETSTGLVRFGARDYEATSGRWTAKDPTGLSSGELNLYSYVAGDPINLSDPEGQDWLRTAANIAAGFGDYVSFGATDVVRDWMGTNDVIDHGGGAYLGGSAAGFAVDILATAGGGLLRGLAKGASRVETRAAANAATRGMTEAGRELHHLNPLFGHPGGIAALFPLGGLPALVHSGAWNLKLLARAEHLAAHRWMRVLEQIGRPYFSPLGMSLRTLMAALRIILCP